MPPKKSPKKRSLTKKRKLAKTPEAVPLLTPFDYDLLISSLRDKIRDMESRRFYGNYERPVSQNDIMYLHELKEKLIKIVGILCPEQIVRFNPRHPYGK